MKREHFEDAHTYEMLYRSRNGAETMSGRRRIELSDEQRLSLSTRGASKHVTGLRFSLDGDDYDNDVRKWVPEELHVHRTLDMGAVREPSEEERVVVFEVAQYQTSGDGLSVKFVPQKPVR